MLRILRTLLPVLLQRLAFGVLTLLVIAYFSYFGLDLARGRQFGEALESAAEKTAAYTMRIAQGDLGETAAGSLLLRPLPIKEVVPQFILRSLGLLFSALLLAAPLGIALGIWAARRRTTLWSMATLAVSILGISLPSFFIALLLQLGVIQLTRTTGRTWLPAGGFGWDLHLLLPAIVLAARPLAQITRVTYVTLHEILGQDYVRTAYSKGLSDRLVMNRHVLLNAAAPVLTTLGLSLRYSLISLPVVEYFFSWPGMGYTLLKSIAKQDDNLTAILFVSLGVLFILTNLILDISYRLIDPQLRATPEHIASERRESMLAGLVGNLRSAWGKLRHAVERSHQKDGVQAERQGWKLDARPYDENGDTYDPGVGNLRRAWIQGTLRNPTLILGAVFMIGLLVMIAFGPEISPHSPYTTQGLTIVNGEMKVPPFPPDAVYPAGTDVLGRDILSLIIAGAQQTLFLTVLVVVGRMLLGFSLGALAGWMSGSWLDRLITSAAEVISAFPSLLLAMILILALGIRQGMQPFIIALCFVGWGEIMQFVRSEVMGIQPKLFIESAVAIGLRSLRIVLRHVLPNLAPTLISIAALEMGAVLMLLGELGFLGIFIGGGAFAELDVFGPQFHYSDVPEWGALLSNIRTYARAYPWTAIYPSLAFFLAILGFNFFGEGVRRLVEAVGVRIMRIFNRYSLALLVVAGLGFFWVRGSRGSLAYYQNQAQQFSGARAMAYLGALVDPALEGRALGTQGMQSAAEYIAARFEALDVQPAGDNMTYFQPRTREYATLAAEPVFQIEDGGPALIYHHDFVELPSLERSLGEVKAPVRFFAIGDLQYRGLYYRYPELHGLDYSNEILMVLSAIEADYLRFVPNAGVLVVEDDPYALQRRYSLSIVGERQPILWISPQVAERLLAASGKSLGEARQAAEALVQGEVYDFPTGVSAFMRVETDVQERVTANHVIGYIPGTKAGGLAINPEDQLDNRMIVVMAQYDNPASNLGGEVYPGANYNASAIAVMLETIENMRQSGYQPYKTLLFVAYSGEGFEGGHRMTPEVAKFLQTKFGFSEVFKIEAIVELRGLGTAEGENLEVIAGGSLRLANLFESAARRVGTPVQREGEDVDLSIIFEDTSQAAGGEEAPRVGLVWEGWEATANTPDDTLTAISPQNLEDAGRALSLALMILGRETDY